MGVQHTSIHGIVLDIEIFHSEKFKNKISLYPNTTSPTHPPMLKPQFVHCLKTRLMTLHLLYVSK